MSEQGTTLVAFIESQLAAEEERRKELIGAADKQLTTSAGFVALLVAVASLALGKDFSVVGGSDRWATTARSLVVAALIGFSISGALAARIQAIRPIQVASSGALTEMLQLPVWHYSEVQARNLKAIHLVNTTISMRAANARRADLLKRASLAQVSAALVVAAAIGASFLITPTEKDVPRQIICLNEPCPISTPSQSAGS